MLAKFENYLIIHHIRGERVMLDFDLAQMYGVKTKRLKEQARRNKVRFPDDFMFQLTKEEFEILRSQFATSNKGGTRLPKSEILYLPHPELRKCNSDLPKREVNSEIPRPVRPARAGKALGNSLD